MMLFLLPNKYWQYYTFLPLLLYINVRGVSVNTSTSTEGVMTWEEFNQLGKACGRQFPLIWDE